MMSLVNLLIVSTFGTLCYSFSFREFENPPEWDVMEQGPLYLHFKADTYVIPSRESGKTAGTWLTRVLCYGNSPDIKDISNDTCGIPGPTLVLHPNDDVQSVYLINHLKGIGTNGHINATNEGYKDPDVINLHVHGLNVYPSVDNVVNIWVNPVCPNGFSPGGDFDCYDADDPDIHHYNYTIHSTHYPGTHWYHGHWHGSTTIHVNGGFYGVIKMKAYEDITDLKCYEPQLISDEYDHIIEASFIWLNTNDNCSELLEKADEYCSFNGGKLGSEQLYPDYVYSAGVDPFRFAMQGWCWIECKFSISAPEQSQYSQVHYDVEFDEDGEWSNQDIVKTFLINGVHQPTLVIKVGEWHRLRILNTNMAYLIWQLNPFDDTNSHISNAITEDICTQYLISLDGVYFSDGPRLIDDSPYYGSVVIPPGGRANIMILCHETGNFSVIASNNTRDTLFSNAPVPNWVSIVMNIFVEENNSGDIITDTDCQSLETCIDEGSVGSGLPCKFVPYLPWSPYLAPTENLTYPDVTSACQTPHNHAVNQMTQCNIVLGHVNPGTGGEVSVNHIGFGATEPLLNIATNITHEWLVTTNFHQFHQHIWPYQLQTDVVDGWLAQTGEWRDVVGAPGSYIARSNFFGINQDGTEYYPGFFHGKLIQHCHFVPHEDHGLMAYHELMPPPQDYSQDPIIPSETSGDFTTPYDTPAKSKWVKDCDEFSGITSVIIKDSNTLIILFFRQFKYDGYCFFGYLPIVTFREGHVSNAFIGIGLWGTYQNNFIDNTLMDGTALAFTLQASTSGIDLDDIYVAEVELFSNNHTFKSKSSTPTVCQETSYGGTFSEFEARNRQYRYWYCVRPTTTDYPSSNIDFNPSQYIYSVNKPSNESFGYAFAYGEGQFYEKTNHASRGACGMFFIDESDNNNNNDDDGEYSESIEDKINDFEQDVLQCFQKGEVIGERRGQVSTINRTHFNLSNVFIDGEAFITFSGYDTNNIPNSSSNNDSGDEVVIIVLVSIFSLICLVVLVYIVVRRFYKKT